MGRFERAVAVLLTLAALTGCSAFGAAGRGPDGTGSPTPSVEASSARVAQARRLAAQYDYDAALSLLATAGVDGSVTAAEAEIRAAKQKAVAWTTPDRVPHLFWHPLVIDPKRAFFSPAVPAIDRAGNAQYMVTEREFRAQLQSIYDKGYVLVHPSRLYAPDASGRMRPVAGDGRIKLPPGKKPLVLSEDDVNYYSRWDKAGFPRLLKLAADGTVVNTYQDAAGAWHEGAYDVPTVVDAFVRQHPDFSYRGDKGTLAVTGYEGVLGYRSSVTTYGDNAATRAQAAEATKVAAALKADGWRFASHTWHHLSYQQSSAAKIQADMERWNAEVKPIVGPTDTLIFAFGSDIVYGIGKKYAAADPKYAYLRGQGFRYFFPIDNGSPYFVQVTDDYYRQWRVDVDGITMQKERDGKPTALRLFFDTDAVWDPGRPARTPTDKTGVR